MFGLGMNNNGTGLVLVSMALADHPQVMLPIIFYNLVQHLVASLVDFVVFQKELKAVSFKRFFS
jgi:BASS family bile acid:Na+ symporter